MAARRSFVALFAALALGCGPRAELALRVDAGMPDSFFSPPRPDAAPAIDAAPPEDPVLPAQAWEIEFPFDDFNGERTMRASILIDARAESGVVRTVVGANGYSSNVVFDVVSPGRLEGRGPIDLGASLPVSDCRAPIHRIDTPALTFRDRDGDGIFEELSGLAGAAYVVDGFGGMTPTGRVIDATVTRDTRAPTLVVSPEHPIGGVDVLRVMASEPIDPVAAPFVEAGGRRFALHEATGTSAPSRWWLDLSTLPPATGYVLRFAGEVRDLAGNVAEELPDTTFDSRDVGYVQPDGFEGGLDGIDAEDGVRALTGDEVPLAGSTSVFTTSRTAIAVVPPRTASFVSFTYRAHADDSRSSAPWMRAVTDDGRIVGTASLYATAYLPGTVAGFELQSEPSFGSISFPLGAERVTVELVLEGTSEPSCGSLGPTDPAPIGLTIDSVEVR